jgi:class 3 adenylate cyclase
MAGRILVSSAVRELCLGKGFQFDDKGLVELKGFDEPMRVYEVRWSVTR